MAKNRRAQKTSAGLVLERHAPKDAEGLALGGGQDGFEIFSLIGAIGTEEMDALGLGKFAFVEGAIRLSDKIQALDSSFLNRDDLLGAKGEFLLHLGRDQHRVAEGLILDLVKARGLLWREDGEGAGIVVVDEREELLIRRETRVGSRGAFFDKHAGLRSQFGSQRVEARFLLRSEGEIRLRLFVAEEDGNRAGVVRGARGGAKRGGREKNA